MSFYTESYAQVTFKAKSDFGNYYLRDVKQAANGNLLMSGDSKEDSNFIISRFTTEGSIKWSNTYSNLMFSALGGNTICATKDNGFLVIKLFVTADVNRYYLLKCDSSGNIIWKKGIDASEKNGQIFSPEICESPDGSIYVAITDIHHYFKIIKVNANGNLLWYKRFPFSTYAWNVVSTITSGADNGLILMMTKVSCESYCSYAYIQKLNEDGITEWGGDLDIQDAYSYTPLNVAFEGDRIEVLLDVTTENNISKYCYCTFNPDKSDIRAAYIDYNVFALKDYFLKHKAYSARGKTLNTYNGTWIMNKDWSLINVYQDFYNVFLYFLKYDILNKICPDYAAPKFNNFISNTEVTIGDNPYTESYRSISMIDFNVIVTPAIIPYKITCAGSAPTNELSRNSAITILDQLKIHLYPNPARDVLYITGLNVKSNTTLTVVNAQGFVAKRVDNIKVASLQINVSQLAKGTYYLKAEDATGSATAQFYKE